MEAGEEEVPLFDAAESGGINFTLRVSASASPAKSTSKTVARETEKNRKHELKECFNNITDQRRERICTFRDMAEDFYDAYKLRLPDSAVFPKYAIRHLNRLLGRKMLVDFNEAIVTKYQNNRFSQKASPKTINEEVGFLLRILGEPGDLIRVHRRKKLKHYSHI